MHGEKSGLNLGVSDGTYKLIDYYGTDAHYITVNYSNYNFAYVNFTTNPSEGLTSCVDLNDLKTNPDPWGRILYLPERRMYFIYKSTLLCNKDYLLGPDVIRFKKPDIWLDCNGATIDGDGNKTMPLSLSAIEGISVSNCHFKNYDLYGIISLDGNNCAFINNTIENCMMALNVRGEHCLIDHNTIRNCSYGGLLEANNIKFTNNLFRPLGNRGLFLRIHHCDDCLIDSNTAVDYSGGIMTDEAISMRVVFSNNTMLHYIGDKGGYYALDMMSGEDWVISNNTFEDSHYSVYIYSPAKRTQFIDNIFINGTVGVVDGGISTSFIGNTFCNFDSEYDVYTDSNNFRDNICDRADKKGFCAKTCKER
jgi:hypothetical protein